MREIRTSGLTSGDGKRGDAAWPKPPRPSSTLQANHDLRLFFRSLFQPLRTGLLNLFDLVHDEPQAGHVAPKFEQRVGRERHPLGGPQRCETVRRLAQRRLEASNPEADQTALHPADQARALTDEPLALTARALGILLRQRWRAGWCRSWYGV